MPDSESPSPMSTPLNHPQESTTNNNTTTTTARPEQLPRKTTLSFFADLPTRHRPSTSDGSIISASTTRSSTTDTSAKPRTQGIRFSTDSGRPKSTIQFGAKPTELGLRKSARSTEVRRSRSPGPAGQHGLTASASTSTVGLGTGSLRSRKMSSPPPPDTYTRGVSFDTFDSRDTKDFSLTLNYKHKNYNHTRRSRTFLCGTDQNDYSEFALEWLIDELVDDGDEIVCLRVVEKDSKLASDASRDEHRYRQEAQKLLDSVIAKNTQDEKAISLVMELAVGKVQEIIQRMIQIYEPAVLIVGTRGKSLGGMQGLLPGSVSKYCLQQSPIPVIVVRPSNKRQKKKAKRLADPTRRSYTNVLAKSSFPGLVAGGNSARNSVVFGEIPKATDLEAVAVAEAIGLVKPDVAGARRTSDQEEPGLTKVLSARSDATSTSPSPTGRLSPDASIAAMSRADPSPLPSPEEESKQLSAG